MRSSEDSRQMEEAGSVEALPDLNPWREAGWIFRDGGCIAIERLGDEIRSGVSAD
jgi:hypothetical protein